MDVHDHTIAWMIAGGLRADPAEARNLAHLRALRDRDAGAGLLDRLRAAIQGRTPVAAPAIDRVCCAA